MVLWKTLLPFLHNYFCVCFSCDAMPINKLYEKKRGDDWYTPISARKDEDEKNKSFQTSLGAKLRRSWLTRIYMSNFSSFFIFFSSVSVALSVSSNGILQKHHHKNVIKSISGTHSWSLLASYSTGISLNIPCVIYSDSILKQRKREKNVQEKKSTYTDDICRQLQRISVYQDMDHLWMTLVMQWTCNVASFGMIPQLFEVVNTKKRKKKQKKMYIKSNYYSCIYTTNQQTYIHIYALKIIIVIVIEWIK